MNQAKNNHEASVLTLPKINFRTIIVIFLALIGLYLLLPKLVGAEQAILLLKQMKKGYLLLAFGAEFISYCGAAMLLGIILFQMGYRIGFWSRFKISSIAAFAIHFFPLGSLGEGAVDYYFLRRKNVSSGAVLLMLVLRIIFTYSAFLLIFLIGLILVPSAPYLYFSPKLVALILFLLIFSGCLYMIYLYRHKEKFRNTWGKVIHFFSISFAKIIRKEIRPEKSSEIFEDIYQGMGLFRRKKRTAVLAAAAAILYWLGDISCLFFVFLGFGYSIHWTVLIFGYGVSTLAGLLSMIPGGIGVTEGALALIYASLGVPASLAVTATLVFRLFSFWLLIPFGLYSFYTLQKEGQKRG